MDDNADFEEVVNLHYPALYRFAFSLTHQESDASDLTQQTFYVWARKGHQLKDRSKTKSWLFTTLHREFLQRRRKFVRYSEVALSDAESELPDVPPPPPQHFDSAAVFQAMQRLDPVFQSALSLFYLEDYSYAEIAGILEVPLGTVKSRISRGIEQLQRLLQDTPQSTLAERQSDD